MKTSIIIPVLNEEKFLPDLLLSLEIQLSKNQEVIFVDNGSTDNSKKILTSFFKKSKFKNWHLIIEKKLGFAKPLNTGVKKAKGQNLIFLDADTLPSKNLIREHETYLEKVDISVGSTNSKIFDAPTNYGKLACLLFEGHSERTAKALAHALPWGPTCNLAVKHSVFHTVGIFSEAAAGAMDIDWCWRAVLQGFQIEYNEAAKITHYRRNTRSEIINQFERYGMGEAWLLRTYQFLSDEPRLSALEASLDAFQRIRKHPNLSQATDTRLEIEEIAVAFSSGIRAGYESAYKKCPQKRKNPKKSIGWPVKDSEWTIYVPQKGIVNLSGDQLAMWKKMSKMKSVKQLASEFRSHFHLSQSAADAEAKEFWRAFLP
ncbi:MAG: glycosyltransferase [Oligoflexia bacterium]|nr:glycosyltransferase [Oligoflexia bacterium]